MTRRSIPHLLSAVALLTLSGCSPQKPVAATRPALAPAMQPSAALVIDPSRTQPMYRQLVAIDLPTVMRVAAAQNLDIQKAQQRVAAARGQYETSVESVFPVIAPAISGFHLGGVNQNANGTLTVANFSNFLPAVSVQWVINPGQVIYDIVAAKKQFEGSGHDQEATALETRRLAAVQYYDLVLTQARIRVARQALDEASELLRIAHTRVKNGTGLPVDELRAQTAVAGAQQDLLVACNDFYQASVALSLTLRLDSTVTLVPHAGRMSQTMLVRDDLPIDALLAAAVRFRPDLAVLRSQVEAAKAEQGSIIWGGLGPQFQTAYTFGGLQTRVRGHTTPMHEQDKASGTAGFALGLSTFGKVKTAEAHSRLAQLEIALQIERTRAAVVSAQQNSLTAAKLIPVATQQVTVAEESLRLTRANLQAGTMLTLDVLQAQAALDRARLRYATALVRYNQSQVNLLSALGLLDEQNVVAAVSTSRPPRE